MAEFQPKHHVIENAHVQQIGILQKQGCLLAALRPTGIAQLASSRALQKGQQPQQGRFAAAIGASEEYGLALFNRKVLHTERLAPIIALHKIAGFIQIGAHARPLRRKNARARLTTKAMSNSTRPRAIPWAKSPLLVSRAMAVVMVRVA